MSVLTASSIFGRIIPGALADKVGRFNMQVVMSLFSAIIVLALALPASSNAAFIVFAVLYGFASGAYVALLPAQIAFLAPVEKIGTYTGVIFSLTAFAGLVGNPVAGAIAKEGIDKVNIFAGVLLLVGAVMFTLTRMQVSKWKLLARV
jgi:MFS family permease